MDLLKLRLSALTVRIEDGGPKHNLNLSLSVIRPDLKSYRSGIPLPFFI